MLALRERIPQVTALDDPVVSNTIYPIPSVAPQYSLMGYNPYNLMLAQQFPWFGTLRLRGEAAEQDVKVALAELGAAELDAVAAVKRAYLRPRLQRAGRGDPDREPQARGRLRRDRQGRGTRRAAPASRTCSGPRWWSPTSTAS